MNIARTARTVTQIATVAALLGAVVMLQGSPAIAADAQATAHKVIDLPRVEIIVRRNVAPAMQIVELPRVVITVRRGEGSTQTQVVQAQPSNPV